MSLARFRFVHRAAGALAIAVAMAGASSALAQPADTLPARIVVRLKPGIDGSPTDPAGPRRDARRPPSSATVTTLSARAGWALEYVRTLADGSHVLAAASPSVAPSAARLAAALRGAAEVERADEDLPLSVQHLPNDPELSRLWNLKAVGPASFGADFEAAWSSSAGRPELVVAVLDTGVLPHPDLVDSGGTVSPPTGALASEGYDFISDCRVRASCPAATPAAAARVAPMAGATDLGDWISASDRSYDVFANCKRRDSTWHGTHVAGVIAALGGNAQGVVGGAYGARLLPVRVLGKCGGYMSDVAEAVRWAAGVHPTLSNPVPARILNLSIGGLGACGATLQSAIDAATAAGSVVVVAAGNDGGDAAGSVLASCANVVAVAATTQAGDIAFYSNRSATHVALSAPGGDARIGNGSGILSTINTGQTTFDAGGWSYAERVGTSSATPHVAAAAALLLSRNPAMSPSQVRSALVSPASVAPFADGSQCNGTGVCGAGILDAGRLVAGAVMQLRPSVDVLRFGNVRIATVTRRDLTVGNPSDAPMAIGQAAISGANGFSIVADDCSRRELAAGGSCAMTVAFDSGSRPGVAMATLALPTPAGDATLAAVQLDAAVGSRLDSARTTVTLPATPVGVTVSVEVSFTNLSTARELLMPLRITGGGIAVATADSCSNVELEPGGTCSATIAVTPRVPGSYGIDVFANSSGAGDVAFAVALVGATIDGATATTIEHSVMSASGGGGGGGCTILAAGATPDATLALLALGMIAWRRTRRGKDAARG